MEVLSDLIETQENLYAGKIYVCMHAKIPRQWKSTLTQPTQTIVERLHARYI